MWNKLITSVSTIASLHKKPFSQSAFRFGHARITDRRKVVIRRAVRDMEQHILKYEFHISKVLKFIEIY